MAILEFARTEEKYNNLAFVGKINYSPKASNKIQADLSDAARNQERVWIRRTVPRERSGQRRRTHGRGSTAAAGWSAPGTKREKKEILLGQGPGQGPPRNKKAATWIMEWCRIGLGH